MNDKRGREGKKVKEKEEKKKRELKNSNGKHKQDVCMAVQHPQKNDGAENAMGASNPRNQVRTFARSHVRTFAREGGRGSVQLKPCLTLPSQAVLGKL